MAEKSYADAGSELRPMSNFQNVDHVKASWAKIKNCLVRHSHVPLTSKLLFSRARQLLALSARAASVVIPSTFNSRTSSTTNNMAPAVANGPIEPSGVSTKGCKSSKLHSKVVGFPLPSPLPSPSHPGIDSGALSGRDRTPDNYRCLVSCICAQFQPLTSSQNY